MQIGVTNIDGYQTNSSTECIHRKNVPRFWLQLTAKAFRSGFNWILIHFLSEVLQINVGQIMNSHFNDVIQESLNKFSPCTIRKTSKPKSNKYKNVAEIADAKQLRRALERKYLKAKTEKDKKLLKMQREVVRKLVDHHRSLYYQDKILSDIVNYMGGQTTLIVSIVFYFKNHKKLWE